MKNIIKLSVVILLLVSCAGDNKSMAVEDLVSSGSLEQLRAKKTELSGQQQQIDAQLKALDEKINELNPQLKVPLVTTITTKEIKFEHFVELQGNVMTKQNIVIHPEYSGVLTKVYVQKGETVRKGQALAKIDDGGLGQQLAQMQIQADLAKTTFDRQKRLWEQKIGSEIQYLQAKSNYEAQQKAIAQMQKQIGKTIVRAPFSGTIDDVITEQGTVVSPGQSQLFRLVNLGSMYIETDVPESYLTNVTVGKNVEVNFPVLNQNLTATVRQAGNFINPANRTFKVEIGIPNKDKSIKPNLTAKLRINDYTNEKAILIPQSIISENADGEQYVYIATAKNKSIAAVSRVIITTGKTRGDDIEVLTGLENGAQIIEEGARSVKDGQEVKILEVE